MPTVIVSPDLILGIDGSRLQGRRPELTIRQPATSAELARGVPEADVLVISNEAWDDAFFDGLEPGDLIQSMSAGYDKLPVDRFRERGLIFANSDLHGSTVAEHAFAPILALSRRLKEFHTRQRSHDWDRSIGATTTDYADRTVTIVGLGTIGEAVARRARGFGFEVRGLKRDPADYGGCLQPVQVYPPGALTDLLPSTTVLVLAVPLTAETNHLIDHEALAALPDDAVVINVARGPVIDQEALVDALEAGSIGGAGLDVFPTEPLPAESPLWSAPNTIITPHVALHSDRYADRFADLVLENYDRWRRGNPIRNRVV